MKAATDELRDLENEHHTLEEQLRSLTRRAYLTPNEQQHVAELKKRKLSAKDRLYELRKIVDHDS